MANEDFIFRLGADISQFSKSITQVEAELKSVRNTLKTQTGQAIVETNKYITQLESSLVDLRKVGLDKLPQSSTNGAYALNSLSQVARDLPFGFVAIQNNLPIVVDQFTMLAKTSGGLGGALKAIGASLIGPAGLSFAFGAVIAGVTALTQKYGSLGEAFNQILGLTPKLTEAQKAYNKAQIEATANVVTENAEVSILLKTLNNLKAPQKDRLAAYNELKNIAPDVVAGIRDENALTNESIVAINKQAEARLRLIKLKIQEAGITAALTANESKLAELRNKLTIADENYVKAAKGLSQENKNLIITGFGSQTQQEINNKVFNDAVKAVQALRGQIGGLESENNKYLQQLDPVINGIAGINYQTAERIRLLKDQIKAEKEASKETGIWTGFAASASFAGDDFNHVVQANAKNLEGWRYIIQRVAENTMAAQIAMDGLGNSLNTNVNAGFQNLNDVLMQNDMLLGLESFQRRINGVFKKIDENTKATTKELSKNFNNIANIIESALVQPLTYLFDTVLEGGKISWKEFGNLVIEQLKRILVQIIATTAAVAIADAITGGGYSATAKLADKATGGGGFTRSTPGAVNMGGITQGGLAMSGSVSLSLRGSDLIGAINRTNTNINRIG